MKYFNAWILKNHPQIIENYPTSNSITLWEQCCRYHKEIIKEYRLDVDAVKTIEQERDSLQCALEKACKQLQEQGDCPPSKYAYCHESNKGWSRAFASGKCRSCWAAYLKEE